MKFVQLHTWIVKQETGECKIKGPMSPMLVAQEFCDNHMKEFLITGLYRLQSSSDEPRYSYIEDNQIVTPDILAVQCIFNTTAVIADLGGRTLPILLVIDGREPVFTEISKTFHWHESLPPEKLISLVKDIDAVGNGEQMLTTYQRGANDWFNSLSKAERDRLFSITPDDVETWWNGLSQQNQIHWFKKFTKDPTTT